MLKVIRVFNKDNFNYKFVSGSGQKMNLEELENIQEIKFQNYLEIFIAQEL
ncbi:hypothetical protein [Clostridium botulinum]|nr:hypothetical protein [Clostridium botulinum]